MRAVYPGKVKLSLSPAFRESHVGTVHSPLMSSQEDRVDLPASRTARSLSRSVLNLSSEAHDVLQTAASPLESSCVP